MLFEIVHRTRYRYSQPVFLEPFTVRLRPRCDVNQHVHSYRIDVSPNPGGITGCVELHGNNTDTIWFNGLHEQLQIATHSRVETHYGNPFDFLVTDPAALKVPLVYAPQLVDTLAPYRICGEPHPQLARFAREIIASANGETIPFLTLLSQAIYQRFEYMLREHGDPWTPEQTISQGRGSCRDFAILFIDICRCVGLAARFVSGYCISDQGDGADMHAWAEVYLPGAGWRGFDPSLGLPVNDDYIAVASGQRAADAAPTFGHFRGEATAIMDTEISVNRQDPAAISTGQTRG